MTKMTNDNHLTSIPDLYDKISKTYAEEYSKPSYKIDEFIKLLHKGAKVLDVGCGPGKDYKYMSERGLDVFGVDLSKDMINLARKKNPEGHFKVADMRELNLQKDSFDGILVSFSLIHIPKKDMLSTVRSFYSYLKTGGIIFFGVQEGDSDEITVAHPLDPNTHFFLNVISSKELRQLLKDCGFEILKQYRRPAMFKKELNFKKLVIIAKK